MPTPKQMDKLAAAERPTPPAAAAAGPADDMPPEYWQAVAADPRGLAQPNAVPIQHKRLGDLPQHILQVSCRRCDRIVEIQRMDAVRLYGLDATWKTVGQRLLDHTCSQRTGRHEEDGCWASFDRVTGSGE